MEPSSLVGSSPYITQFLNLCFQPYFSISLVCWTEYRLVITFVFQYIQFCLNCFTPPTCTDLYNTNSHRYLLVLLDIICLHCYLLHLLYNNCLYCFLLELLYYTCLECFVLELLHNTYLYCFVLELLYNTCSHCFLLNLLYNTCLHCFLLELL